MISGYTLDNEGRTVEDRRIAILKTVNSGFRLIYGYGYCAEDLVIVSGVGRSVLNGILCKSYRGLDFGINPAVALGQSKVVKSKGVSPRSGELRVEFDHGSCLFYSQNHAAASLVPVADDSKSAVSAPACVDCGGKSLNCAIVGEVITKLVNNLVARGMLLSVVNEGVLKNNYADLTLSYGEDYVVSNLIVTVGIRSKYCRGGEAAGCADGCITLLPHPISLCNALKGKRAESITVNRSADNDRCQIELCLIYGNSSVVKNDITVLIVIVRVFNNYRVRLSCYESSIFRRNNYYTENIGVDTADGILNLGYGITKVDNVALYRYSNRGLGNLKAAVILAGVVLIINKEREAVRACVYLGAALNNFNIYVHVRIKRVGWEVRLSVKDKGGLYVLELERALCNPDGYLAGLINGIRACKNELSGKGVAACIAYAVCRIVNESPCAVVV